MIPPAAVIALRALRSIVNEDPTDRLLRDWQVEANEYLDRLDALLARAEPQKEQFDDQHSQSRLDRSK